eukprot:TRINITY_DN1004_c0_g1_i1.p1 TRINITY_DN1004_c0_g1~~TRINITY_DN1004_c0_g1_i1.p1  ORF type:complete len:419 (+),score=68.35 TRINITY_DN1004_c0_g1_i1:47-1303(+)
MPTIRVGFLCGKDTDFVEHPGKGPKYSDIGDASFLADFPDKWRVDPVSHEYLMDCDPGTKGQAHCDAAIAWYIKKHFKDIEIDIITPEELSIKRLHSNHLNFTMGYNAVSICVENNSSGHRKMQALQQSKNLFPTWKIEDFILYKSKYMKACMDAGVPMAPTIFSFKGKRSPAQLLSQIKERGWRNFVMKQSTSGFCLGFLKLSVEKCEKDPNLLGNYFKDWAHIPEFIVQEAIDGFTRNWETRCFWFNGKFLYAIANKAAVSTKDGKEHIVTGNDIPKEFLEAAKKIGQEAIKVLPDKQAYVLVRTDIGCSDSQIFDREYNWNPKKKTFFLNEIEPSSTTYFVRHLKFDCIPLYAKLFAAKARELYKRIMRGKVRAPINSKALRNRRKDAKKASSGRKSKLATMKVIQKSMKVKARK